MTRASRDRQSAGLGTQAWVRPLQDYFWRSNLPLTILVFLVPMIVLYEVGTHYVAYDVVRRTETRVLAFNLLREFLAAFGATGRYLPCLAIVGVFLTSHIVRRDPWQIQLGTASFMAVESALLAFPVLALGNLLGYLMPLGAGSTEGWRGGLVLALGAGIYEEMIFRLGAFTILNIVLVDLLRIDKRSAWPLIVLSTASLFAAYHHWSPQSDPFRWADFIFRTMSGIYFGALFLTRGFGVTAGTHAAYDIYYFALRALSL